MHASMHACTSAYAYACTNACLYMSCVSYSGVQRAMLRGDKTAAAAGGTVVRDAVVGSARTEAGRGAGGGDKVRVNGGGDEGKTERGERGSGGGGGGGGGSGGGGAGAGVTASECSRVQGKIVAAKPVEGVSSGGGEGPRGGEIQILNKVGSADGVAKGTKLVQLMRAARSLVSPPSYPPPVAPASSVQGPQMITVAVAVEEEEREDGAAQFVRTDISSAPLVIGHHETKQRCVCMRERLCACACE